ncbi:DUF4199 domain-containing protein [Flavobacterium sp. NKUCC04_CG]|uniref:DUF4199 domain-containing protein n=1 Tax=Flavobacterium sp. NKUCC04_CG TaxID=2842121 RepID=UPI001C5ACBE2|nr:DUF4199 domain-containing protein [Flavobacterium sp. NKUCC04_CG]MBW3519952.1 DUF4199 domain-containing protein [Flavobacterium sp. NKUCC04_CG]
MNSIRIEIKWAVLFTLMGLLWMVLEKLIGLHSTYIDYHLYVTNLFAIPAIYMMVLALKDKKKNFYNGQMSYSQGFVCGLIMTVFIAMLSPLAQWITTFVITPEYFPNVIKRSVELGYYKTISAAEAQFNYSNYATQGAIGALIMGILTTAIAMVFIRTKKAKV